jgi:RNA polymerase sigma-70 factor (ECF subfamily)
MVMSDQSGEFAQRTEPFRRELLAHCYRMLGSADEAEDLVQETYLRAWRSYGTFKGRSSLRTWLYRIATNACLTALEQRARRALPSGLGGRAEDPDAPPGLAEPEVAWLGPIPDTLVTSDSQDPATIVAAREGLRLALIASLQHLPARPRAVLLLRDVLGFPAAEVAAMLGTSTAAVKSTLQRARARLEEAAPAPESVIEPTDPNAQALLGQYIAGFQNADTAALEKALRTDAAIELVGTRTWFSGRATCLRYLAHVIGSPGDWLMTPTRANGQPAAATYYRNGDGTYRALGVAVLTVTLAGIARITVFADGPGLVATFGFPPTRGVSKVLWSEEAGRDGVLCVGLLRLGRSVGRAGAAGCVAADSAENGCGAAEVIEEDLELVGGVRQEQFADVVPPGFPAIVRPPPGRIPALGQLSRLARAW